MNPRFEVWNRWRRARPDLFRDDERGIKIAAPAEFELWPPQGHIHAPLPLLVGVQFNGLYLAKFEDVFTAIKVVVVDTASRNVLSGGIVPEGLYSPMRSGLSREELAQRTSGEYQVVDLLEFFPLPHRTATYRIYALLEKHKSNVLTIKLVAR